MMAGTLQVAGGCLAPLLPSRRAAAAAAAVRPPRASGASASAAAAVEEDGKVRLGGSDVAVTKLGIGAWSWGDTTYWNEFQWDEKRLRDAYERLKKRGVPLASNQVNYSLIYRNPEENGVKAACDELGITLIAYSPIAQGVLTGKYTPNNPPTGPRGRIYTPEFLTKLQPLINRIKEIGGSYEKTPTQCTNFDDIVVVLNWLICQGNVVPIPGAKNAEQAREFAGALGWSLTDQEVEELRSMAREIKPVIGFPVEKL
uniref:NADP-dependent oxidoreductase domain-containing protein n=1 Tax=Oryza nivara TaxID=4536 RepID=A0A0E0HWE7_ORYNI